MRSASPGRFKDRAFAAAAWLLTAGALGGLGVVALGWRFAWVFPAVLAACDAGVRGARFLVRPGFPISGMAGVVLDEAVASRWARGFTLLLCGGLALVVLSTADVRLDYWEQSFLGWGLLFVEIAVGALALALAAMSVSGEYANKCIHTNLAKPVGRFHYLAGKWLGLMLVSGVFLGVSAGAVVCCARAVESRFMLESSLPAEAKVAEQEAAVRTVLAARFLTTPAMENPEALDGYFFERLDTMASGGSLDASAAVKAKLDEAKAAGGRWPRAETFRPILSRWEYANCMELATGKWYTLGHAQEAANLEPSQVYVFSGLQAPLERARAARAKVLAGLEAYGLERQEAESLLPFLLRRRVEVPTRVKAWALAWSGKAPAEYKAKMDAWAAQLQAERLQLALRPNAGGPTPRTGVVELRVDANGAPVIPSPAEAKVLVKAGLSRQALVSGHRLLPSGETSSIDISADRIDDEGRLAIRLTRVLVDGQRPQPTVSFDTANAAGYGVEASPGGIRLYGQAGGFAQNIGSACLVLWVKVGFLAMLGLVCGSLFSFPVACLLAVAVYFLAAFSGGLRESFDDFTTLGHKPTEGLDYGLMQIKAGVRWTMLKALNVTPDFDAFDARGQVVDGRQVGLSMLARCAFILGLVWTGAVALVGWLLFERREIARVTV